MEKIIQKTAELIGSGWMFIVTLLLFVAETSWLALTSRFPMAFDEAWHFGLIQFYSHRLNPIVTSQDSSTYRFGAIIGDPSFLYHYLLSFPDRFITLFTGSLETKVIILRFINIGFAVISLIVLRKLLRLLNLPGGFTNVAILAFALTPIVTVLSSQINYDNLLILAVSLCAYQTILFINELGQKVFNTKRLLMLLCLCLFSSLVKFTFVPIFIGITLLVIWRVIAYQRRGNINLLTAAKQSFVSINKYVGLVLFAGIVLGSFFCIRLYAVNLVTYHSPIPQCNQILSVQDCSQYYSWNRNYVERQQYIHNPALRTWNVLQYTAYWASLNVFDLFGEIMPLQGLYYISETFFTIIGVLGTVALVCTILNFRTIVRRNVNLLYLTGIGLVYILFLWARNYNDFRMLGRAMAIDGRYLIPVLIYFYALLGLGLVYALEGRHPLRLAARTSLALVVIILFVYYGGYAQYTSQISPVYGHLNPDNYFLLTPT